MSAQSQHDAVAAVYTMMSELASINARRRELALQQITLEERYRVVEQEMLNGVLVNSLALPPDTELLRGEVCCLTSPVGTCVYPAEMPVCLFCKQSVQLLDIAEVSV